MTWTVAALGNAGTATTVTTPLTSMSLAATVNVNDGIAVFVLYTDFQADLITITDNASPPNTYTLVDNLFDSPSGELLASFYLASAAHSATTITANWNGSTAVFQDFGVLRFTNSVAGTPTLDGNHGLLNTTATTTPNSGAATSTNGDLVLSAIVHTDLAALGTVTLGITGVSSPTIGNNHDTVSSYRDGYGVTTTGGVASVISTWTLSGTAATEAVVELIFAPPSSGATLMGQIVL